MVPIGWQPRWREELVATTAEGRLVFELKMGSLRVYFPDEPTRRRSPQCGGGCGGGGD